jgi:hypothetical protein
MEMSCMMNEELEKDCVGSNCGIVVVLPNNLPGETQKNPR